MHSSCNGPRWVVQVMHLAREVVALTSQTEHGLRGRIAGLEAQITSLMAPARNLSSKGVTEAGPQSANMAASSMQQQQGGYGYMQGQIQGSVLQSELIQPPTRQPWWGRAQRGMFVSQFRP